MSELTWTDNFVGTRGLSPELGKELVARSKLVRFKKGDVLFSADQPSDSLMFLVSGRIRVRQINESGREIVLFRANAGESCVMTTAGLLVEEENGADGIAESDVEAALLSRKAFDELMGESAEFRHFVIAAYHKRIRELFQVVDEVAFGRIDIRLASRLVELAGNNAILNVTHQELAYELGTAREVISRQLNEFQKQGVISQSRGSIELKDINRIKAIIG